MDRRQNARLYSMPRRRARHRDKIFSYIGMLTLYILLQLVLASSKSVDRSKVLPTTKETGSAGTTPTTADTSTARMKPTTPAATMSTKEMTTKTEEKSTAVPTWRPKRENCTAPAIEQFPRPLMGPSARKHGGIIIHILVAIYAFIALAIVCDDYFVSSLDRICEDTFGVHVTPKRVSLGKLRVDKTFRAYQRFMPPAPYLHYYKEQDSHRQKLKLSPDVAGATFMAAGSSAPELATVVIGVFFAKDDIGVSGVIGSAVFNIMFVIAICALCSSTVSYLNWWPLCRDCFFYALSILLMLFTIYNEKISWGESLIMLIMYAIYCGVLHYNPILEKWAQTWPVPCKRQPEEQAGLVTYKTLNEDKSRRQSYTQSPEKIQFGDPNFTEGDAQQQQQPYLGHEPQGFPQQPDYYKPKPSEPNPISPLVKPTDGALIPLISWYLTVPIHYMCTLTLPDCKSEKYKNWYPFTFVLSMAWISFYSYIMVWMITICGSTMGIPDTVMGLTFVAAGVSVPDALSSLAVVKEGYGDMAVSNAVGSNVFDILICLGLPWFIQTALIKPGSHVNVISKGLTYSTLSLLSTVLFLLVATHMNGWKLDKKYGVILMIWYILFITFASLYELNVFGYMNPPECISEY